jgi:hypothetical protein
MRAGSTMKSNVLSSVMISLVAVLVGCTSGKPPFLTVQLCLGDERNLADFAGMIHSIAESERMKFLDGSAETKRDLKVIGAPHHSGPVINMGLESEDGVGLMAGDLDSSDYQMAIGFSEGSNPSGAHEFAESVISRLKTRWEVETVPAGKGAFPKSTCER